MPRARTGYRRREERTSRYSCGPTGRSLRLLMDRGRPRRSYRRHEHVEPFHADWIGSRSCRTSTCPGNGVDPRRNVPDGIRHYPRSVRLTGSQSWRIRGKASPLAESRVRRRRAHVAGRRISGERLRLHDMIANVWEWTTDWYVPRHPAEVMKACCVPRNPRGPKVDDSDDPCHTAIRTLRKDIKGGSHPSETSGARPREPGGPPISARRPTAAGIGRPRASPSRWTRQPATSVFAASSARRGRPQRNRRPDPDNRRRDGRRFEELSMAKTSRPNILVIWGDDIGITNLRCYSSGFIGYPTPNPRRP